MSRMPDVTSTRLQAMFCQGSGVTLSQSLCPAGNSGGHTCSARSIRTHRLKSNSFGQLSGVAEHADQHQQAASLVTMCVPVQVFVPSPDKSVYWMILVWLVTTLYIGIAYSRL